MDWYNFATVVGTGIGIISFIYSIYRNFKNEIEKLDNRIFQLAMGKSLKEILLEENKNKSKKGKIK